MPLLLATACTHTAVDAICGPCSVLFCMNSFAHHHQAFSGALQPDVATQQGLARQHTEAALPSPCRLSPSRRCSARGRSLISRSQTCYSTAWALRAIRRLHISTAATLACQLRMAVCSGALVAFLCSNSSGMLFSRHLSRWESYPSNHLALPCIWFPFF